tara:strand:- start:298 stop:744 length:447 start_codon:yes stop_codon:yes gene_type:complete
MFKLVIFLLGNHPYHSAIIIDNQKIADLSLLGSKILELNLFDFSKYDTFFFNLNLKNSNAIISYLEKPIMISKRIIDMERSNRGWYKTKDSAEYILNFRSERSKDFNDMNCIEWIIYALELGHYKIPKNIMTASKLLEWSKINLKQIK